MHALRMALVGLIALTMGLAGCSGNPGDKEALGTILGAVGGGIAGSQVGKGRGKLVATGIGTLLGAAIGNLSGGLVYRVQPMLTMYIAAAGFALGAIFLTIFLQETGVTAKI